MGSNPGGKQNSSWKTRQAGCLVRRTAQKLGNGRTLAIDTCTVTIEIISYKLSSRHLRKYALGSNPGGKQNSCWKTRQAGCLVYRTAQKQGYGRTLAIDTSTVTIEIA